MGTSSRKTPPTGSAPSESHDQLVKDVVAALKPEIKNHVENLRADLFADIKEHVGKLTIPSPKKEPTASGPAAAAGANNIDLQGLINKFAGKVEGKDGGISAEDISMLTNLTGGGQQQQLAIPQNASPELVQMMLADRKQDRMFGLLVAILPRLIQQPQQSPVMNEMMQRIFLTQVLSGSSMNQIFMKKMVGDLPGAQSLYQDTNKTIDNLTAPIHKAAATAAQPAAAATPGVKVNAG